MKLLKGIFGAWVRDPETGPRRFLLHGKNDTFNEAVGGIGRAMKTWKNIVAVFCGILVNVVFSTVTDLILELLRVFPPLGEGLFDSKLLLLALSYRLAFTFFGGYVTAKLSPISPKRNVVILGSIGTVLAVIGIVVGWDMSQRWYPVALALTAYPITWAGGRLGASRRLGA